MSKKVVDKSFYYFYQANCSFRAYKNTELRAHHTCKKTGRLDFSLREHVGELKAMAGRLPTAS
jgi:hypothetical protein